MLTQRKEQKYLGGGGGKRVTGDTTYGRWEEEKGEKVKEEKVREAKMKEEKLSLEEV